MSKVAREEEDQIFCNPAAHVIMSEVEKAVTLTMAVGDTDEEAAAAAKAPDADDAAGEEEETASQQRATTIKTPEIVILPDTTNPDVRLPPR